MKIINYVSNLLSIDSKYIVLLGKSLLTLLILQIIKIIVCKIIKKIKNSKVEYELTKIFKYIITILKCLSILFIWSDFITKMMTLITFVSAAFTIAIRDVIFNFFSGLYIKIAKPFSIEDRIEINNYKGDVININALNFELLEVNNKSNLGQSTGIITHIPNSNIFNYPLRNYNKGFKYIWNELDVRIPIDYDMKKAKKVLLAIVNKNEVIKDIPKKIKNQINDMTNSYRIYYNVYTPTIYIRIKDNYAIYTIRYLMHPKKAKTINSELWTEILKAYQNNQIEIYKD